MTTKWVDLGRLVSRKKTHRGHAGPSKKPRFDVTPLSEKRKPVVENETDRFVDNTIYRSPLQLVDGTGLLFRRWWSRARPSQRSAVLSVQVTQSLELRRISVYFLSPSKPTCRTVWACGTTSISGSPRTGPTFYRPSATNSCQCLIFFFFLFSFRHHFPLGLDRVDAKVKPRSTRRPDFFFFLSSNSFNRT